MADNSMALNDTLMQLGGEDFLRDLTEFMLNRIMDADVTARINADRHERTEDRETYRNGYRDRAYNTRVGTLDLRIPKLREGTYFPSFLEARKLSEKALNFLRSDPCTVMDFGAAVVETQPIVPQASLQHQADQPGRHAVYHQLHCHRTAGRYADQKLFIIPAPRQWQRFEVFALLRNRAGMALVMPQHLRSDEAAILVDADEVGVSTHKQRLTYPPFEMTMCRFHRAILVTFARIIMRSQYAIVLAKGGIARRLLRPLPL